MHNTPVRLEEGTGKKLRLRVEEKRTWVLLPEFEEGKVEKGKVEVREG